MSEKKILVVEDDLLKVIDENRGDMSRADFIKLLIQNQLEEANDTVPVAASKLYEQYVTREEFQEFTQGMKDLLRRFLDFFISYGLELGQEPKDNTFTELVQKLQSLSATGGKPKSVK
jgi:hypothetical protein